MSIKAIRTRPRVALHGIVLASGHGVRMRALTDPNLNRAARPKAMLPVGNMTLVDFSIEALKGLGLSKIYVGAGPRPMADILERRLVKTDLYDADIQMHSEDEILDTAGTVNYLMQKIIQPFSNATIVVLPCDTPHNIDLNPILRSHKRSGAAVTVAALPIRWSSREWAERTFGTIHVNQMPKISDFTDRNIFERDVKKFTSDLGDQTYRVDGFHEKIRREEAPSNLINTGIYFFKASFLMDLAPMITARYPEDNPLRFSDFGLHVFPLLAGRFGEFANHKLDALFMKDLKAGNYPFNAYVLPPETYWRDVGNPISLVRANMDVLDGKLCSGLPYRPSRWERQPWGWRGLRGSSVAEDANIAIPEGDAIGSIIGNHATVDRNASVERSVILNYTEIGGRVVNSVVFPGTTRQILEGTAHIKRNIIGQDVELHNSILTSGELRFGRTPSGIRDVIVYENTSGGISFDPL